MGNVFHCFGKTGKPGLRIIAIIDIGIALFVGLGGLIFINFYPEKVSYKDPSTVHPKYTSSPKIVAIVLLLVGFFLECCLFNLLWSAIKIKNEAQCDNWIKLRIILLGIFTFFLVYWLSGFITSDVVTISIVGGLGLTYCLYRAYTLLAVKLYQNEISMKRLDDLGLLSQGAIPLEIIKKNPNDI